MNRTARSAAHIGIRWWLLSLIRLYRGAVSPSLPRACRFEPSCAAYAEEAIARRPLPDALWLIARRISKCHPFHPGGYDPVP